MDESNFDGKSMDINNAMPLAKCVLNATTNLEDKTGIDALTEQTMKEFDRIS